MKTKEEIVSELKLRLEKAMATHRQERESEYPDIRTKENAWAKIVAYSRCLKLINDLKT